MKIWQPLEESDSDETSENDVTLQRSPSTSSASDSDTAVRRRRRSRTPPPTRSSEEEESTTASEDSDSPLKRRRRPTEEKTPPPASSSSDDDVFLTPTTTTPATDPIVLQTLTQPQLPAAVFEQSSLQGPQSSGSHANQGQEVVPNPSGASSARPRVPDPTRTPQRPRSASLRVVSLRVPDPILPTQENTSHPGAEAGYRLRTSVASQMQQLWRASQERLHEPHLEDDPIAKARAVSEPPKPASPKKLLAEVGRAVKQKAKVTFLRGGHDLAIGLGIIPPSPFIPPPVAGPSTSRATPPPPAAGPSTSRAAPPSPQPLLRRTRQRPEAAEQSSRLISTLQQSWK